MMTASLNNRTNAPSSNDRIGPPVQSGDVEAVFHAALAIADPVKRGGFLEQACQGDPLLRRKVAALLKAQAGGDRFFESSVACLTPVAAPSRAGASLGETTELPGATIGSFQLLEELGRGGFGVVYRAQQTAPVRREVAIKIIKLGMDTREVVRRFEAERQVLALMAHPHIAAIYDAGATATGRPFFAMELVRGCPITSYCDGEVLGVRARLELFIRVCQAVEHAHQKGVIHRDLKPSNILVSTVDGQSCPKVIDFGIVKAATQPLTNLTWTTQEILGTPAYMSPEQASSGQVDIDTRADVYSLGALLYELLTGHPPLGLNKLQSSSLELVLQTIREEQPPKPSLRFRQLALPERRAVAGLRGCEPDQLLRQIRGELDWIVLKALEKDRAARYGSAISLAEDLARFLNHEPVSAAAPTASYYVRKFVRRHRAAVAAAAGLAVILALSSLVSSWLAFRAIKAERQSTLDAANARRQAAIAEATRRFLTEDLLGAADPMQTHRLDTPVRQVLDEATQNLQRQFHEQPLVEAEIRATLARIYSNLGEHATALTHAERALALRRSELGETNRETLRAERSLAVEYFALRGQNSSNLGKAEAMLRTAWQTSAQVLPADDEVAVDIAAALASAWFDQGRSREARQLNELALTRWTNAHGLNNPRAAHMLANLAGNYAASPEGQSDPVGVEQLFERALALSRQTFTPDSPNNVLHLVNLGAFHLKGGNLERAELHLSEAISLAKRTVGNSHAWTWRALRLLAQMRLRQSKTAEAAALATQELTGRFQVQGPEDPAAIEAVTEIGAAFEVHGAGKEALEFYRLGLNRLGFSRPQTAQSLAHVSYWLIATQDYSAASDVLASIERQAADPNPNSPLFDIGCRRALALLLAGRHTEYREQCQRLLKSFSSTSSPQIASAVSRVSLATPDRWAGEQAVQLRTLITIAGNSLPAANPESKAQMSLTLALERFRAEDWTKAAELLQATADSPVICRATGQVLLALMCQRRGENETARRFISTASQTVADITRSKFTWWDQQLFFLKLLAEAQASAADTQL